MPIPLLVAAGASLVLKGIAAKLAGNAKKKREEEARKVGIAQLQLGQKQSERTRMGRLGIAKSLLNGVGQAPAYGGRVNPNTALDPELAAQLGVERKDDFSNVVPRAGVGAGSEFLSGLASGAADTVGYLGGGASGAAGMAQGMGGPTSGTAGSPTGLSLEDLMKLRGGQ